MRHDPSRATATVPIVLALLVACSGPSATHVDPNDLVSFALPDGWVERSRTDDIRYGPGEAPDSRTVLAVSAEVRDPEHDLAAERELRQSQIRSQGQEVRIDETFELNGWSVWESAAARAGGGPVMHSYHLFSDDVQAEVWLLAVDSEYATHRDDLRALAESVRAR